MEVESNEDEANIKSLIHNIRSTHDADRKLTISQIPFLILQALTERNNILNQLLLVIYNLTTETENYETLNASNRTLVIRHLLRLYTETIQDHQHEQIDALAKIIDIVNSSELLVELAYVLHKCGGKLSKEDSEVVKAALGVIQEKAAANLNPEALLMIHSIIAIK